MRRETKFTFVMAIVAIVVTVVAFVSFGALYLNRSNGISNIFNDSTNSFDGSWLNEYGVGYNVSSLSLRSPDFDCYNPLYLTKEIPELNGATSLFFRTNNLVVNVYIDGECVYFTSDNGYYNDLSAFSSYCYLPLSSFDAGKEIKLEIYKTPVSVGYCIDNFVIGKSSNVIYSLFAADSAIIVAGILTIVAGIIFIWMGVISRKVFERYRGLLFFGMFAVLIGIWFLTDTLWIYNLFSNIALTERCSNIFLTAALPCFMMFIYDFFNIFYKRFYVCLSIGAFSLVLILLALDLTGVFTYGYSTFVQHGYIVLCGVTLLIEMISYLSKVNGTGKKSKIFNIGVVFFVVFALLDVGRFYQGNAGDSSLFTRFGMFVLTVTAIAATTTDVVELLRLGIQAGKIGKIAYTDANTGLGNPAAFKSKFEELDRTKSNYSYIGIIQFDVNNLKIINDNLGHEAGDLLIKTAAEIIDRSFGVIGNCYRVGGDEFVAITTYNHAPLVCEDAIIKFENYIEQFNNNPDKPFELRIAYGVAYYQNNSHQFQSLKEVHKLADQRMYNKKKELKARYAKKPEEAVIR